jgi:hypothetical protein
MSRQDEAPAPVADAPAGTAELLLALQRSAGNQVGALVRRSLQRSVVYHHEGAPEVKPAIQEADALVQGARDEVLVEPGSFEGRGGYLGRWANIFKVFRAAPFGLGHKTPFLKAAFGYAVEELAGQRLRARRLATLPDGCALAWQAGRASTRPDVILTRGGGDVAWLDITSSGSEGHVLDKQHTKWKRGGLWVAELLYPSLEPEQLGAGSRSPEEREASKAWKEQFRQFREAWDARVARVSAFLDDLVESNAFAQAATNRAKKRLLVERQLALFFGHGGKVTPRFAKGVLALAQKNFSTFGYGGVRHLVGRNTEAATRELLALPDADEARRPELAQTAVARIEDDDEDLVGASDGIFGLDGKTLAIGAASVAACALALAWQFNWLG